MSFCFLFFVFFLNSPVKQKRSVSLSHILGNKNHRFIASSSLLELDSDQKNWRSREMENDIHAGISSIRHVSVSDFQLRWPHHTSIRISFALRSPASASSVGCNGGVRWSAPVGWIGVGDFLLTPNSNCSKMLTFDTIFYSRSPSVIKEANLRKLF